MQKVLNRNTPLFQKILNIKRLYKYILRLSFVLSILHNVAICRNFQFP